MEYIRVLLIELPERIRGLTAYYYDEDGQVYYTMLINSKLNNEMQCQAYDHEIRHINNRDFDSMVPATELEKERHAV